MDRITPPPNYYGAPYPNNGTPNMNNPYPSQNQPPYPNAFPQQPGVFPAAQMEKKEDTEIMVPPNTPSMLEETVKNVQDFYASFRQYISKNIGNHVKVYCAFTDATKWHDMVFEGILIASASDYMILKNDDGHYTIITGVYVNFVELFEK